MNIKFSGILLIIILTMIISSMLVTVCYADNPNNSNQGTNTAQSNVTSVQDDDEIIPDASRYFSPKNHPEVWKSLSGPMMLGGAIVIVIGVIAFFITIWFVGVNIIKVVRGRVVGKAIWGGLVAGVVGSVLLVTGTWYNLVNTSHKAGVQPTVQILEQESDRATGGQQQAQPQNQQKNQQ